MKKLEKIRNDDSSNSINELTRVAGIGPAKARELLDLGINSVEELKERQDLLTKGQKIGLKHFEDFELRIPREEISQIESLALKNIKQIDEAYQITICGSYRRGNLIAFCNFLKV